jgi:glycosyltransferase involved in cell wall biosynthesis
MSEVLMIDPSLFTPAYDSYLISGLKEAGADVEWLGCRDVWGMLEGYREKPREYFYQAAHQLFGRSRSPLRQGLKLAGHVLGMARLPGYARGRRARLMHFQWAPVPELDHQFWGWYQKKGLKIVFTVHNLLPHQQSSSDHEKYRRLYWLADRLVVHDTQTKQGLLEEFGLPRGKITEIPMPALPIPGQLVVGKDELKELMGLSGRRIALCFGFIEHYKGFDLAVAALGAAKHEIPPDVVLVIAGRDDSGQAEILELSIKRQGLEGRVVLRTGFMEQGFLKSLVAASDLCLFPYRRISQSGALLTAMAEGKAVVGFNVGGIGEAVEQGRNGLLVAPGDTMALGKALAKAFSESGFCQKMGSESLALVEQRHSYLAAGRQTMRLYQEMLS